MAPLSCRYRHFLPPQCILHVESPLVGVAIPDSHRVPAIAGFCGLSQIHWELTYRCSQLSMPHFYSNGSLVRSKGKCDDSKENRVETRIRFACSEEPTPKLGRSAACTRPTVLAVVGTCPQAGVLCTTHLTGGSVSTWPEPRLLPMTARSRYPKSTSVDAGIT